MARAVAQYVFAALLALLSTQTALPSRHVSAREQIVWCAENERQAAEPIRPARVEQRAPLAVGGYTPHVCAPPDTAVLFQRPPPSNSLFV